VRIERISLGLFAILLTFVAYAATVTDNFNRGDNATDLGGNWTDVRTNGLGISSNAAYSDIVDSDASSSVWTADSIGNDQYTEVTITTLGASVDFRNVQLLVRQTGDHEDNTQDGYGLQLFTGEPGTAWRIVRWDNSVETEIEAGAGITINAGDRFRIEIQGSTIRAYQNDMQLGGDETDATYASGRPGLIIYGNTIRVDDFEAGDLGGGNPFTGPFGGPLQ